MAFRSAFRTWLAASQQAMRELEAGYAGEITVLA
jgi:hypothetical protein